MSCGCGGECCKQSVAGLGVIPRFPTLPPNIRRGRMVRGIGFIYTGGDDSSGDYYDYPYIEGGDGWDYWYAPYYGGYDDGYIQDTSMFGGYDPNSVIDRQFISDRLPDSTSSGWQQLVDWWRDLTGGFTGNAPQPTGGGYDAERGLPGYCRGGTHHPDYDPYICVPFPAETPAERNQRQQAAAKAQAAQKAAAAAKAAQQAAQPCPPNTGLVKNAQGQCVCPNGLQFSKSQGKCVLPSQLTAEDKKALEGSDLWKYLAIGAFVLIGVKALQK